MTFVAAQLLAKLLPIILHFLPWRRILVMAGLPIHDYRYRNPSCRTCARCKKHQNEYTYDIRERGWWEDMHPGHPGHKCSGKDAIEPVSWDHPLP